MNLKSKVQLGDKVTHTVSGFTGIVVARTEWLNGCWRITVQPKVTKDSVLPEAMSFDEFELKVLKPKHKVGNKETGGPRDEVSSFTYKINE